MEIICLYISVVLSPLCHLHWGRFTIPKIKIIIHCRWLSQRQWKKNSTRNSSANRAAPWAKLPARVYPAKQVKGRLSGVLPFERRNKRRACGSAQVREFGGINGSRTVNLHPDFAAMHTLRLGFTGRSGLIGKTDTVLQPR